MKIQNVILSKNDDPLYDGFWEINSEICAKKLQIKPILLHITDQNSDFYEDKYGLIKKVKIIDGIRLDFQSQIVRMFATKFFPNEVSLISDIDMLIFNKTYFIDQISSYDDDSIIIYTSDGYKHTDRHSIYPMCYIAGKGNIFNKILKLNTSFEEYVHTIFNFDSSWYGEEVYFAHMLNISRYNKIIKLNRGWDTTKDVASNRLDRSQWDTSKLDFINLIDIHCLRPYSQYKKEINSLKKIILHKVK